MGQDALIHQIHPVTGAVEKNGLSFVRKRAALRAERNFEFQMFGQCEVNWKHRAQFFPLPLACGVAFDHARNLQRCQRIVHGLFTQKLCLSTNCTATALTPSRYCTSTTVPSPSA